MFDWFKAIFSTRQVQPYTGGIAHFPGSFDTNLDYRREAGDLTLNAVVSICIQFLANKADEAPLVYQRLTDDGWQDAGEHEVLELLETPNLDYDLPALMFGTIASYSTAGNAYWYKVREGRKIRELTYLPHYSVTPVFDERRISNRAISAYRISTVEGQVTVPSSDIVHLRHGMNPRSPALGISPLAAVLKEITVDNWAASYSANLLNNLGVGSYLLSPKLNDGSAPNKEQAAQIQDRFNQLRREGVGRPIVSAFALDVKQLNLTPEDMALDTVIRHPVSRICAALGLDPMALGLPSSSKTYNNYGESLQAALENGVVPMLSSLAKQITGSLLWDEGHSREYRLAFDISGMRGLQEDVDNLHARVRGDFNADLIDRETAKIVLGYPVEPGDRGLYASVAKNPWAASMPAPRADNDSDQTSE
jgi:HK97 family phage portal protein